MLRPIIRIICMTFTRMGTNYTRMQIYYDRQNAIILVTFWYVTFIFKTDILFLVYFIIILRNSRFGVLTIYIMPILIFYQNACNEISFPSNREQLMSTTTQELKCTSHCHISFKVTFKCVLIMISYVTYYNKLYHIITFHGNT